MTPPRIAILLLRVALGGLFVWAGFTKLGDPARFATDIANYRMFPSLAPLMAVTFPPIEIVLGLALVAAPRLWRRAAALAVAALMALFTVAVAQAVARGINVDCGCFGGSVSGPVTIWTVARDVALTLAAAALAVVERSAPADPDGNGDGRVTPV
jgi:uncharacterized membrane protein YphA (DoxX/SURF4 family)